MTGARTVVLLSILTLPATGDEPAVAIRGARLRAVAAGTMAPAPGEMGVSVRCTPGQTQPCATRLEAAGFAARGGPGEVAWVTLPAAAELQRLGRLAGVRSVETARRLRPHLDRSVPQTGATVARQTLGLDGGGVLIGVIDTGADFRHADLRAGDGSGATRLDALLDFAQPADDRYPDLKGFGGAVYLAADIDAQLAADAAGMTAALPIPHRDMYGHGTHVAGIAAGGGLATTTPFPANRYVGMAPAATLVVVQAARGNDASFGEGDIVDGVRFVFERARRLGRPAVVNLSLGGDGGPHDGTTSYEVALSSLVPPGEAGRAVVVSAGNGGGRDQHAGGWLLDGPIELRLQWPTAPGSSHLTVELWTDNEPRPPAITVVAPDGAAWGPFPPSDTPLDGGAEASQGRVTIASSAAADPVNGRHDAVISVTGNHGRPPLAGTWHVLLDGKVQRWDAWVVDPPSGVTAPPRWLDHLDADGRSDHPATAANVIAVGAYVTRNSWPTRGGSMVLRPTVPGQTASFSGTGPTTDGRFFPDLIAPGEFIVSSLSRDALPDQPQSQFRVAAQEDYLWADDGVHGLLRGTSQAAPHVAGAVALLFQLDPTLTAGGARELLRAAARVDADAPGYSPRYGFGRLDVAAAAALRKRSKIPPVSATSSTVGVSRDLVPPGATPVRVSVVPRDDGGAPVGPGLVVTIDSDAGAWDGPVLDLGAGRYERIFLPSAPRGTVATLSATAAGTPLGSHPRVFIVADRTEVGHPFAVQNGCATAGPSDSPATLATILAALLLLPRRRRGATRAARAASKP